MDSTTVTTILIGIFTGFNSGMFGIGGALLSTPLLRVFVGLSEVYAVATPLPAAIPAAISGSIAYLRAGLVRFDIAGRSLIGAIPATLLGAYLTNKIPGVGLMVITGVVLLYSAWLFIRRGWKIGGEDAAAADGEERRIGGAIYLYGALAGFTSGFLAIGGGMVLVPVFAKVLRLPTKVALATSLFCVAVLAIPGTITHSLVGNIHWPTALILCASVIPTGYLGARLATSLRTSTLEKIYGCVMMLFSIYFIIRSIAEAI